VDFIFIPNEASYLTPKWMPRLLDSIFLGVQSYVKIKDCSEFVFTKLVGLADQWFFVFLGLHVNDADIFSTPESKEPCRKLYFVLYVEECHELAVFGELDLYLLVSLYLYAHYGHQAGVFIFQ
jgi:hypothetical protein